MKSMITKTAALTTLALLSVALPVFALETPPPAPGSRPGMLSQQSMEERYRTMGSTTHPILERMMGTSTRPMGMPYMSSGTPPFGRPFNATSSKYFGSSTKPFPGMMGRPGDERRGSSTADRMERGQDRGGNMLDQRIDSLNKLLDRVQGMENISDADKAALISTLEGQIKNLEDLKVKINSDTSTTTLKADLESITKANRIYMLVEPKARITAASDRIKNILEMLATVKVKIDGRLAENASSSSNTDITAALADYTTKVADAKTQVDSALTLISPLVPDNGDKTKAEANRKVLQDAKTAIEKASNDVKQASEDLKRIARMIKDGRPHTVGQDGQGDQGGPEGQQGEQN